MTLSPKCILDVATFELTNDIVLKSFYVKNKQKNILSYSFPNNFLSNSKNSIFKNKYCLPVPY